MNKNQIISWIKTIRSGYHPESLIEIIMFTFFSFKKRMITNRNKNREKETVGKYDDDVYIILYILFSILSIIC